MAPIIRTDGLTKDYGRVRGLDNLSLEVQEGEVLGFLGPNGAGKTTTIRLLLDLIRPTRGSASVGGFDCRRESLRARRLIGYLPGEMPVYPELSGDACITRPWASSAPEPPDPVTIRRLSDRFDIRPGDLARRLRDLSHGTKRKFGILSALMARPKVAILDEPTSGLDPLMIEAFAETMAELEASGRTTVFLSSHVLSEVERTCDRVAVIRDGRLAAVQTIAGNPGRASAPGHRALRAGRWQCAAGHRRRPRGVERCGALGAGGRRPDGAAARPTPRTAGCRYRREAGVAGRLRAPPLLGRR